jgi:hypothetical protein
MGRSCDLCKSGQCAEPKLNFSMKTADIAFYNVECENRYEEDCKTDLKVGLEMEVMEYGDFVMTEGETKETMKTEGVALSVRFTEARETVFGQKVVNLESQQDRLTKAKTEKDDQERLTEEVRLRVVSVVDTGSVETRARRKRRGATPPPGDQKNENDYIRRDESSDRGDGVREGTASGEGGGESVVDGGGQESAEEDETDGTVQGAA